MASIRREVVIAVASETLWDAVRDVGALHTRLVAGFVTACRMDGDARVVTFSNGMIAREVIVDIDEKERRLVWASVGGRLSHHNASAQVFAEAGDRCRLVWIADFLPNELEPAIAGMIEQGLVAMKKTVEGVTGGV